MARDQVDMGCFGVLVGGFLGGVFALMILAKFIAIPAIKEVHQIKQEAVARGAAEYDSTTGDWRWKDSTQGR